jgi:uncharacterized membrane protein (UPF0127 family)
VERQWNSSSTRRAMAPRQSFSLRAVLFTALFAFTVSASFAKTGSADVGEGLETLEIITTSGTHKFLVEVMRTDLQRQRGLMFRRVMPGDRGMLFAFQTEQPVSMWMKNTFLPLDMIFIANTGKVVGMAENTEPLSETTISSGGPSSGVLELNAGTAAKIRLKIGDIVRHSLFTK